jgi:hypothetical protein
MAWIVNPPATPAPIKPRMYTRALTFKFFIQYSFVCLYATIIAFGELLVNRPKSSNKVVLSRNHEINISATKGKIMLATLLQRLAKKFPSSDYQSRLDQYITNRNPQSTADVEHWERRYFEDQRRGIV